LNRLAVHQSNTTRCAHTTSQRCGIAGSSWSDQSQMSVLVNH